MRHGDTSTAYLDLKTIHRDGNLVTVWGLFDYHQIQIIKKMRFWSRKQLTEYFPKGHEVEYLLLFEEVLEG